MKKILLLLIFIPKISFSQEIYNSEKRINDPENYIFKEIEFPVGKKITLGGTLITPKGDYSKIVIIAAGAGKNTRHSHYILAEQLLKNGIAVYRYDDRGVRQNGGKFKRNAYHNIEDLRSAFSAVKKLNLVSEKTIGILGHSTGAYAASIINYEKEFNVDFLVLIGSPIEWEGKWRKEHKSKDTGKRISEETIHKNINVPTLFISGVNDTTSNALSCSKLLKELGNKNIEVKILDNLDHFLRAGTDEWKQTKDYSTLYQIAPKATDIIINWTKNTVIKQKVVKTNNKS